jgi:hypothetical protein
MEDDGDYPSSVIVPALRLARERVTGDDPDAKEREREALADMIVRVRMHGVMGPGVTRPTAAELTEILGDPDDGDLRKALAAW